jgi:hypothetical protein
VKKIFSSAASRAAFSSRSATRTASTSRFGTRGFFGCTRSFQHHTNFFHFAFTGTLKAKSSGSSRVSASASAMRRTSFRVAMTHGG